MYEYEGVQRLTYGHGTSFIRVCAGLDGKTGCGRFVKADDSISFTHAGDGPPVDQPNATCARCGRVHMIFEGFICEYF